MIVQIYNQTNRPIIIKKNISLMNISAICKGLMMKNGNPSLTTNLILTGLRLIILALLVSCNQSVTTDGTPEHAHILYIAPDAQGYDQLFMINTATTVSTTTLHPLRPKTTTPIQLTRSPFGIWDYTVAPDYTKVAYTKTRSDGGHDIWTVQIKGIKRQKLLNCGTADCTATRWSPDSQSLIYERRESNADGVRTLPQLWLLDTNNEETSILGDELAIGFSARWSPNGQRISYIAPKDQGIYIHDLETEQNRLLPISTENAAVWTPQGDALLVSKLQWQQGPVVHLIKVDAETGWLNNLSGSEEVEDDAPAWSPDGQWLAFRRKPARTAMGKQIWLMRSNGDEARALTDTPEVYHGPPTWSPDGQYLAFLKHTMTDPDAIPGIWLLEVETGHLREIITPGYQPAWVLTN